MPTSARSTTELVTAARALVTEHGLHGFTVQDVAERAGVSRRTFFNHFAAKEHAVLGFSLHVPADLGEAEFLASASNRVGLLDAVGALQIARMRAYVGSLQEFSALQAVLAREPRLQQVLAQLLRRREQDDVRLVERWLAAEPGDPRAATAVWAVAELLQKMLRRRLHEDPVRPFETDFAAELALLRDVMAARGPER